MLPACVLLYHMHACYPRRPEKLRSLGTGVTHACGLPCSSSSWSQTSLCLIKNTSLRGLMKGWSSILRIAALQETNATCNSAWLWSTTRRLPNSKLHGQSACPWGALRELPVTVKHVWLFARTPLLAWDNPERFIQGIRCNKVPNDRTRKLWNKWKTGAGSPCRDTVPGAVALVQL